MTGPLTSVFHMALARRCAGSTRSGNVQRRHVVHDRVQLLHDIDAVPSTPR